MSTEAKSRTVEEWIACFARMASHGERYSVSSVSIYPLRYMNGKGDVGWIVSFSFCGETIKGEGRGDVGAMLAACEDAARKVARLPGEKRAHEEAAIKRYLGEPPTVAPPPAPREELDASAPQPIPQPATRTAAPPQLPAPASSPGPTPPATGSLRGVFADRK